MLTCRVRNSVAAMAALVTTAWIGPIAAPDAEAAPTPQLSPQVVFSEDLGDGRVLTRFTHGVTVVATKGTRIVFETTPPSHSEGGLGIGLIPPDYDEMGASHAAQQYRASGRSPEKDERALEYSQNQAKWEAKANQPSHTADGTGSVETTAAPASQPGEVYDSGCAKIDSSVFWRGCYRRYWTEDNDASSWYAADESQGTGHGKGGWYLRTGRTDHRYKQGEVVQWEPSNDVPKGNCEQVGFSLGAYGVSMSRTTTVCPEKISVSVNDSKRFYAQWNGAVRGDNPGVVAQNFTKVPNGKDSGFEYWVYEYHSVYS